MCGPGPWVSLRFYWLLPPGSCCVTWKTEREKALARLHCTYLEAKWLALKPFLNTQCCRSWVPAPIVPTRFHLPPSSQRLSEINVTFPDLSLLPHKTLPSLSSTWPLFSIACSTLPTFFCFLLFLTLAICWSQGLLVAEQTCREKSEFARSFYCIGGTCTVEGIIVVTSQRSSFALRDIGESESESEWQGPLQESPRLCVIEQFITRIAFLFLPPLLGAAFLAILR